MGLTWKLNELKFLVKYFDEILIIPNNYGGNFNNPISLPVGVKSEKPLFEIEITINKFSILQIFDKHIIYYLKELIRGRIFLSKSRTKAWLEATINVKRLLKHSLIKEILKHPSKNTYLYFFWGRVVVIFFPLLIKTSLVKYLLGSIDMIFSNI